VPVNMVPVRWKRHCKQLPSLLKYPVVGTRWKHPLYTRASMSHTPRRSMKDLLTVLAHIYSLVAFNAVDAGYSSCAASVCAPAGLLEARSCRPFAKWANNPSTTSTAASQAQVLIEQMQLPYPSERTAFQVNASCQKPQSCPAAVAA
jgi:hypothetical protein